MKSTKKFALIGAMTFAFTASAFAQSAGGGNSGGGASNGPSAAPDSMNAASGAMTKPSKGTTLHQQNKAHKQKGAAAAAAASSLGTNDKGAPQ